MLELAHPPVSTPATKPGHVHSTIAASMPDEGLPLVLDLAASRGLQLVDAMTGDSYLDMFSFFATAPLGMNPPAMTDDPEFMKRLALAAVNKPSNPDVHSAPFADFVAAFARVLGDPQLPYLFFIDGGALAVENALKAAFDWKARRTARRGRPRRTNFRVLHLESAFHGRSGYTMSLTNTDPAKTDLYPRFDWPRIPVPAVRFPLPQHEQEVLAAEDRVLSAARAAFEDSDDDIACFIAEPVQGEGGDNHMSPRFLQAMQAMCHEYDALFVLDEVQTGCGATGTMWAYQQLGLEPDLVAFGKRTQVCGFMGGRRLDLVEGHVFQQPSRISSTWGGNLTDMVRATRILEILEQAPVLENVRASGQLLQDLLEQGAAEHPALLSDPRGRGLICAVDLPSAGLRDRVVRLMYDQEHVIILPTGRRGVRFRPPLVADGDEVTRAVQALVRSVLAAAANDGDALSPTPISVSRSEGAQA
jgi:L-lysine 6-transaminase